MLQRMKTLLLDEEGATMVEYALLVGLIAVALIGAITGLKGGISTLFGNAQTSLENAPSSGGAGS